MIGIKLSYVAILSYNKINVYVTIHTCKSDQHVYNTNATVILCIKQA